MRPVQPIALALCLAALAGPIAPARAGTSTWTGGGAGVNVAPNGTVVAADFSRNVVQRFSPEGALLSEWGTPGSGPGQLHGPVDTASAPNGDVYVVEMQGTRVEHFTADGAFLGQYGSGEIPSGACVGATDLRNATTVAVGTDGTVYVADKDCGTNQARIRRYDPTLTTTLGTFPQPADVRGLAVAPSGDLYSTDAQGVVRHLSASGGAIGSWTVPSASDVTVDRSGSVFVSAGPIDKFSADGAPQGSLTLPPEARSGNSLGAGQGLVYAGSSAGTRITRIDPSTPTAVLAVSPNPGTQGAAIQFDAGGSSVPFSAPVRYEWDTDGDGTFESDTGATPTKSLAYPTRRNLDAAVRVTAQSGATDVARIPVVVGPPGVSVNDGAEFTNTPHVTVSAVWPLNATDFLLSNDGGFTPATHFSVAAKVPWTLNSTGPERLPKTVYVRFAGGSAGNETYQDDIILDQTPPEIQRVSVTPSGTARAAVATRKPKPRTPAFRIALKASDNVSGVVALQITRRKAAPGADRKFTRSLLYKGRLPVYIRARDRAGNVSRWTTVRQPASKKKAKKRKRARR